LAKHFNKKERLVNVLLDGLFSFWGIFKVNFFNKTLLFSSNLFFPDSRLFYAGACEGQMPEIMTMIQINRLTPAPAVLTIVRQNT